MHSKATTIKQYIDELPDDRKKEIKKLRALIRKNLPKGYVEVMRWGMITYEVPLKTYPDTYNGQPLMYAALGNQKNHIGVYVCGLYCLPKVKKKFDALIKKSGVKLDMGKSCLRFKPGKEIPYDAIAYAIASVPVADYLKNSDWVHKKK